VSELNKSILPKSKSETTGAGFIAPPIGPPLGLFFIFILLFFFLSALTFSYIPLRVRERSDLEGKVWVTDLLGRKVAIPARVQSAATLGSTPIINSVLEILNQGQTICNRPTKVHDLNGRWKMHKIFAPGLEFKPYLRYNNNDLILENIITAKPDISITMTPSYLESIERLNLPIVWVDWATTELMLKTVSFLGEVFNRTDRADKFIAYFHDRLNYARNLTSKLNQSKKKSLVYAFPRPYLVPEEPTEALLAAAGARSLTAELSRQDRRFYGVEDLLSWDPDIILVVDLAQAEALKGDVRLRALRAIKNESFIKVPTVAHMWSGHSLEAPIAALWFIYRLYPEIYSRKELMAEIISFYQTFFNCQISPTLAQEIIDGGW
jgi:iron complex transport system substrate-binding protein